MEFRLGAPNTVHVENVSYGAESGDHAYLVTVEASETVECTCPADQYMDKWRHRLAVEANDAVLEAASASEGEMQEARERRWCGSQSVRYSRRSGRLDGYRTARVRWTWLRLYGHRSSERRALPSTAAT
jgi:hypothetical protein